MLFFSRVHSSVQFEPLNNLFKRQSSYYFKAYEFRNLHAFEFFKLLIKLSFKANSEFRNLKFSKLSLLIKSIEHQYLPLILIKNRFSIIEKQSNASRFFKFLRFKMILYSSFEKVIQGVKFCTEVWTLLKNGVYRSYRSSPLPTFR